jgi:predicted metal-dependent phosphoesterase TrpH
MRMRTTPLLCELHAHTTWSDGDLTLAELVDLYGRSGFDVLCVTDHTVRTDDHGEGPGPRHVHAANHAAYLEAVLAEAERAWAQYDLLVLPGLELTYDDVDPAFGAHAVAVGLDRFVGVDAGLDTALDRARDAGAALIAAHPYTLDQADAAWRRTARFSAEWQELRLVVDRFELFNRHEFFGWVADAGLPAVASGDFHRLEHLATWKTLLPCHKDAGAVVEYLRSRRPAYLVQIGPLDDLAARAA